MFSRKKKIFANKISTFKSEGILPPQRTYALISIALFALAVVLKFGYYRFSYYPILDDYIQYGSYHLSPSKGYVLTCIGTIYQRPFAALSDMYFWGMFRGNLTIAFIIITCMHFVSAFLFKRAFEKINIRTGSIFLIFYLLTPILSEATYWISASTRIVTGLFLLAVSVNLCHLYLKKRKVYLWFLTFITHFLSYGFYEQTIVLSFAVFIFYIFCYSHIKKEKVLSAAFIPIICLISFALYYVLTKNMGSFANRSKLALSWDNILSVARRLFHIFTVQNFTLTASGFMRGISLLLQRFPYAAAVFAVSLGFLFIRENTHQSVPGSTFQKNSAAAKAVLGLIVLILPFAPYFAIRESYPEFRSMYTAVFGIGLILDAAFERFKFKNIVCALLAFIFITANVSEIHDYKVVYDIDQKILEKISSSKMLTEESDIYVIGAKEHYTEVNAHLGAHITNITSSDWALTGAVRAYTKNPNIKRLIPIYENDESLSPSIDISDIQ